MISGDPAALASLANLSHEQSIGSYSDSSQPPSAASSTSSTPRFDAINAGIVNGDIPNLPQFQPPAPVIPQWPESQPRSSTAQSISSNKSSRKQGKSSCCCGPDSEDTESVEDHIKQDSFDADMTQAVLTPVPQQAHPYSMFNPGTQHLLPPNTQFPGLNTDFGAYELAVGCGGMDPSHVSSSVERKACGCGDTCNCFACATHPNNSTTMEYVRYHNELYLRSQHERMMPFQPQPYMVGAFPQQFTPQHAPVMPNGYEQHFGRQFSMQPPFGYQNMGWSRTSQSHMPMQTPTTELDHLNFNATHANVPTFNQAARMDLGVQFNQPPVPIQPLKQNESRRMGPLPPTENIVTTTLDADSPDDTSTLSPSSFLLQQFTLPDCSDLSGTCQCGEGCTCPGCLTHRGHITTTSKIESEPGAGTFVIDGLDKEIY